MTSITVAVPMTIRRRGGRKAIVGPDGLPVASGPAALGVVPTQGDPMLVKAVARAFRWRRMLEDGRAGSVRELAKAEGVSRTYIGRLLKLTLLAPDLIEAILDGRPPKVGNLLRPNSGIPDAWAEQINHPFNDQCSP